MSNDDVERLVAREDAPPTPPVEPMPLVEPKPLVEPMPLVEEVLDAQRDSATTGIVAQEGPLDLVAAEHAAPKAEPASAGLINNTGDDGGPGSG